MNLSLTVVVLVVLPCFMFLENHGAGVSVAVSEQAGDDSPALVAKAKERLAADDIVAAQNSLEQAIAASPNSPEANLLLGDLLAKRRLYPEAMDRFETVLGTDPLSQPARGGELQAALALALQARRSDRQEAALACLKHARDYLADDPVLLHALGVQLFDMHLYSDAEATLTQAIAVAPDAAENIYARARVEMEEQHLPDAERDFKLYLAKQPSDASARYGYGHLLQMQQHPDEARREFQRSIELQPQQTESYFQLGQIALDQGHDDEARPFFERTLARSPSHGGALTDMGILAYRAKEYAKADGYLKQATTASPEYQPAHYYLGLTLAREGDKDGSARELKTAVDLAQVQQGKAKPIASEQTPWHTP